MTPAHPPFSFSVAMPFLIPGSRTSMALRAPPIKFPASPPQSECESVTPRSQPYPDTPPILNADIFDTVPFSASFSAFLNFSNQDDTLQIPVNTADIAADPVKDAKRLSNRAEASYYVEQLTNIRDVDSEWEDDEVEEVMIISQKPKRSPALVGSSVAHDLPTPPFSPPVESLEPVVAQESYTILRTLHRTQTSHLSLAVASGCAPSIKKVTLRHALYAIRTYRLPLSRAALAERAALEVLSARSSGENPYVQRASRFWDDGQTLFIVLEHCGGGDLMRLIQAEGPVDSARMKRWACEITSGISFIHSAGIIHSNIRPSTVLFRVNGHVCLSGFEHAIVIATSPDVPPCIEERQHGLLASSREWCEAPEMLFGWEIGLEVDCWAFGILLIWMITGKRPWYRSTRENPNMVRDCILNGVLSVAPLEGVNTALKHLITKCLDRNPSKRPTVEQIKEFEWFADIDWDSISLARVPDIQITLPTPDMTSDVAGDMPSTIIAPDVSLSTTETEMEIDQSLPWTPARISRPVGLISPGANTIASGQSAVLLHEDRPPFFPGRPQNPSPPSLPSSTGGGDTPTLQLRLRQKEEQHHQSFLPELSEGDGTMHVELGICVDEFGRFLSESEQEHELTEDADSGSGESPQISLQDALALPIPLLVTPRASELELRAVPRPGPGWTPSRLPARLLRWRDSTSTDASIARDSAVNPHTEREQRLPELLWHGLDADPFRWSPPPPVPTEVRRELGASGGGRGREDVPSSRRMDATFRWSNASLEIGVPPHTPVDGHSRAHVHATSFAAPLTALTRRIREQGRALLRKSRSNVVLPCPRLSNSSRLYPSPLPSPLGSTATLEGGSFGSVRRIGLGIGYSLPNPGLTPQKARATIAPAAAHRHTAREDNEEAVPAGCYAGLGGRRRGKKSAALQLEQQERPEDATKSADGRLVCESASSGASPCDSGSVLILGNPGFGGAVAHAAMNNV
ncbi:kinase-like domain-containing protein [Russula compacta]|nr:kinase-like domain-containing protein [Russula compacta]